MACNLLVILGPTASGKTKVGVEVAKSIDGEVISADSRQVYRGMNIGTGKDLTEYGPIPYHLIDIVDPGYEFNVFEFQRRFFETFKEIRGRKKLPILVGGTGLYLEAALKKYDLPEVSENLNLRQELAHLTLEELISRLQKGNPRLHNTTDLLDRKRVIRAIEVGESQPGDDRDLPTFPSLDPIIFGLRWPRNILRQRITERLRSRLNQGLIEEVKGLHQAGVSYASLEFYGLEYEFLAQYLKGRLNKNDMLQKLNSAIHQFAKRQETWFRRMERRGILIHWVEGSQNPAAAILGKIEEFSRQ
ncbi:MAG: tRNA (adenosine(37)-N6)-dimethylallyltransferase MiaA [Deltaproteobacteria bacterium]|nr:tRNA (adenosine(37)-N6)-dimethylallyltransferase MiaA [Deltaproteobacteria bacterium]